MLDRFSGKRDSYGGTSKWEKPGTAAGLFYLLVVEELVQFWDRYFKDHGLPQIAKALGRSGRKHCPCGQELIDIDNRGEILTRLFAMQRLVVAQQAACPA
jgi:hypothetical protein